MNYNANLMWTFGSRTVLVGASLGSIALLLGHLYGIESMHRLGLSLGITSIVLIASTAFLAARRRDRKFQAIIRAGFLGGLLGTIGYDLIRIPFHYAGQNPFHPIRAYGMWLAGSDHSTAATDFLGILYHFSNGITFGWIYACFALGRSWRWAVLWGLILETLAVVSVFGEIFAIRTAYGALVLAYIAHIFYGWPLGYVCENFTRMESRWFPFRKTLMGTVSTMAAVVVVTWFVFAWQPLGRQPELSKSEIVVGPDSLYPGCLEHQIGSDLSIINKLDVLVKLRVRRPGRALAESELIEIKGGGEFRLSVTDAGVHQLLAPDLSWRSILVFASEHGDYRSRPGRNVSSNQMESLTDERE